MAYNKACVIGEVIEINGGERFDIVVLLDRARPAYPNEVACEFFGKSRDLLRDVSVGDWLSIEGSLRSKKSPKTGQRFTNFACFSVSHVDVGQQRSAPPPPPKAPAPPQHREVHANDDTDIPF